MKSAICRNLKYLILGVLMLVCTGLLTGAENFYDSYREEERLMIADAYLSVSEQYEIMGDPEKAKVFREMALEIFPEIEANRLSGEVTAPTAAAPAVAAAVPQRPRGREPSAVRYYFSKLMRGVFTENSPAVMSLMSSRLYLPGFDQGVSRQEVEFYLGKAFEMYPLDKTDPNLIYQTDRLYIRPEGNAWTVTIRLTPEGQEIMKKNLSFPGETHIFYFREDREGWRLIAVSACQES